MSSANRRVDARDISQACRGERLLELVAALGGKFRRHTTAPSVRMPCFLHGGKGPNLVVTPSDGLWYCHSSCGGGDAIKMVELAQGLDFNRALQWLSEWLGNPRKLIEVTSDPKPKRTISTAPLMRELWALVKDAPLGNECARWLSSRGIDPDAALAVGARDWSLKTKDVFELLKSQRCEVLEAAGFGAKLGWAPLARVDDPQWQGMAIPSWNLDEAYPTKWRWRLFAPPSGESKSRSPIGGGADLLGFGRPEHLIGANFRVAHAGESDTLLIVEGEPDWLSCIEATDGRALVVSVCGGATQWRAPWPSFGDLIDIGIKRVVVSVHRGKRMAPCAHCGRPIESAALRCRWCGVRNDSNRVDGKGHGEVFAEDVAICARDAGLKALRRLPDERYDLNDRHRHGELRRWLEETLA